jgi:hypothetical protein
MAVTIGRVQYLKIGSDQAGTDYGLVQIRLETPSGINVPPQPPGPRFELFIIWVVNQSQGPRYLFLTELSRALRHGLRVRIGHKDDSAFINQLVVEAPFEGSLVQ